ncbi:MAG TPA: AcvB/VirJ family lysyl-phosphatidylglycerol hydrolase [Rhodanobacteraceae bacterium]|jgi:type IV secretory pathway VirJ component|nr:AcvB/VirJ family lysyl-phosphatidylglycerol hydrolase [Rhodanobacteraceae bacterium]
MSLSKRGQWIMGSIVGACVLGFALFWNPFARPSLEKSIVTVQPAPGVQAPAGKDDVLTILYSGDGGWADLDKQLGTAFAARGIPVLGVNSFKYFWRARSPDVAAQQLDALITDSLAKWHKQRVWLVGFSFGADVLPTLIDKLNPAARSRITQLVLLSPSHDATFEIQFEGYMTAQGRFKAFVKTLSEKFNKVPEYPALPPVVALDNRFPVVCYYGKDDADDSLCTVQGLPAWVTVHGEAGGHHFDEGYQRLAEQMIAGLPASKVLASPAEAASTAIPASAASAAQSPMATSAAGHR